MGMVRRQVKIVAGGPYLVSEGLPLVSETIVPDESDGRGSSKDYGERKEIAGGREAYALCRCGRSKAKPFCDGTHAEVGFTGEESANREAYLESVRVFEGEAIDLLDKESLCAAARFCDRLQGAWKLTIMSGEKHPDFEELATYEASACPSGRLTIRKDGVPIEPPLEQEISALYDEWSDVKGPLFVKGGVVVVGSGGVEYEVRNRQTLCRCGESRNKPFCDGCHIDAEHMKGKE
jgi:CDGSH-type Zn-finger protein